jgi:hypothetical protein
VDDQSDHTANTNDSRAHEELTTAVTTVTVIPPSYGPCASLAFLGDSP